MSLQIIRDDITRVQCDAIVNAAKKSLLGGGGVDGAIHRAAGPRLLIECMTLGGCKTGQAKITGGYALPAKYVIHTVGPVWRGGHHGEREQLASCYRQSLKLAVEHNCKSVAFPLISAGAFGFPKDQALRIAANTITEFLLALDTDLTVYLVIFNKSAYLISQKLYADIKSYIDDVYVDEHDDSLQHRYERFESAQMEDVAPRRKLEAPRHKAPAPPLRGAKILGALRKSQTPEDAREFFASLTDVSRSPWHPSDDPHKPSRADG